MIFTAKKLIYLHVQKTGGNAVSQALMPFSDDEMYLRKHQDGVNRFSVVGDFTTRKHARLADYQTTLGPEFDRYQAVLPVRDPFERAVSLYFSPHKWFVEKDGGWVSEPSYWDFDRFEKMATHMQSLCYFLSVDGQVRKPDFLMRFDQLPKDFDALCSTFGFPLRYVDLPVINVSSASRSNLDIALNDNRAKALVDEVFSDDYALLAELENGDALNTVSDHK